MICERTRRAARAGRWAGLACVGLAIACGGPQDDDSDGSTATPEVGHVAVPSGATGPPERGDWLIIQMLSDPENLNPLTSNDEGASRVLSTIFQSLLTIDPETLEHLPLLARELPTISDDHLSYEFELRDDPTFSDGVPLTAEDVAFSLKVIRNPKVAAPQLRNYFNSVGSVEVLGPHRVRIELRELYFRNTWALGSFEILPRHYYDPEDLLRDISVAELNAFDDMSAEKKQRAQRFAKQFNENFQRNPMGSGAFVLEDPDRDWVTGEKIVLRHRDDFWAPGDALRGDAWVDRIVYRVINDREAALVAFKSGRVDFIKRIGALQAIRQTNDARFQARSGKHSEIFGSYTYIGWNQRRKIFQDPRVRRALSHMVDKQNLVDKVMFGLAEPVEGPIYSKRPEHNSELAPWAFDPKKGVALLAEAGWADTDGDGVLDKEIDGERVPLRFEIISNAGNDERKKVGLAVIDEFKKHGIDASFRALDWSILLASVGKFDYDACVLGWTSGGSAIPPDAFQIWHSSQAVEDGSNHVAFVNDEVDALLEAYRVEFDQDRRNQLYRRFQEILYDQQPYTFLFAQANVSVWDRRFEGVTWYPGIGTDHGEWWVPVPRRKY
jgi:peptide/nickel transport system substrate-binding protein